MSHAIAGEDRDQLARNIEPEEVEAVEEDVQEPDEPDELDDEEVLDDEEAEPPIAEEDDEDGAASLDELLAQRAARRQPGDEVDEEDIMALASERDAGLPDVTDTRVVPIKDRQEFVCNRCHLVKAKSQLSDPQRGLCRDCV